MAPMLKSVAAHVERAHGALVSCGASYLGELPDPRADVRLLGKIKRALGGRARRVGALGGDRPARSAGIVFQADSQLAKPAELASLPSAKRPPSHRQVMSWHAQPLKHSSLNCVVAPPAAGGRAY